jgi:hypothetical protein
MKTRIVLILITLLCAAMASVQSVRETSAIASLPAAAGLTFADRVAYQSAIEDVYWRHRIWPDTNAGPSHRWTR